MTVETESFKIAGVFTISRGAKTAAEVVTCTIRDGDHVGRGECVPYARYGETIASVCEAIASMADDVGQGLSRADLLTAMPAGAARNAIDCALWDLEAKIEGVRAHRDVCTMPPRPIPTAMTISLGSPSDMAAQARANAFRPLLKVKVGGEDDAARIHAVASNAPHSRTEENVRRHLLLAAESRVALVEQPLPQGKDAILRDIPHPVPICADESVHSAEDLSGLLGLYDAVNIKLDKAGGLTAAMALRDQARELGFGVMVGCMVGTSLAMAPAVLLAQDADFVDLDGPLLLERDRRPGLTYAGSMVSPPTPALWG
jgi:L-alanine-DL-glutamate epimerase-like enolase superfamily enzyme